MTEPNNEVQQPAQVKEVRNKKRNKGKSRGSQAQEQQRPKYTREQVLEHKLKQVTEEGYDVVPRRALETNTMIVLVTKNDFLVDKLRDRIEQDTRIDTTSAVELLKKNRELRRSWPSECEVERNLAVDYYPPRGLENPLKNNKPTEVAETTEEGSETEQKQAVNS